MYKPQEGAAAWGQPLRIQLLLSFGFPLFVRRFTLFSFNICGDAASLITRYTARRLGIAPFLDSYGMTSFFCWGVIPYGLVWNLRLTVGKLAT